MSTQYRRGADVERTAARHLATLGYSLVVRSAGSHGPVDLVALGPSGVLAVQCKRGAGSFPSARRALAALALPAGCSAEVWSWQPRRGFRRLAVEAPS